MLALKRLMHIFALSRLGSKCFWLQHAVLLWILNVVLRNMSTCNPVAGLQQMLCGFWLPITMTWQTVCIWHCAAPISANLRSCLCGNFMSDGLSMVLCQQGFDVAAQSPQCQRVELELLLTGGQLSLLISQCLRDPALSVIKAPEFAFKLGQQVHL